MDSYKSPCRMPATSAAKAAISVLLLLVSASYALNVTLNQSSNESLNLTMNWSANITPNQTWNGTGSIAFNLTQNESLNLTSNAANMTPNESAGQGAGDMAVENPLPQAKAQPSMFQDVLGYDGSEIVGAALEETDKSLHYSFSKPVNFDLIGYVVLWDAQEYNVAGGDFSLSSWIRTSSSDEGAIIYRGSYIEGERYGLKMNAEGTLLFSTSNEDSDLDAETAMSFNDGQWHHVAAVRSQQGLSIWVDGMERAWKEGVPVSIYDEGPLSIGANMGDFLWSGTPRSPFYGEIANPQFFGRALSEGEILDIYLKGI